MTSATRKGVVATLATLALTGGLGLLATGANAAALPTGVSITGLSVVKGSSTGTTNLLISGTGFSTLAVPGVKFGGTASATIIVLSDTQIAAVAPAHAAGKVDVTLSDDTVDYDAPVGSTKEDFTYIAPLNAAVPASTLMNSAGGGSIKVTTGDVTGGTTCATGFAGQKVTATIGGVAAIATCTSPTTLALAVPAGTPSNTAAKVVLFHDGIAGTADATNAKYAAVVTGIDKPVGSVAGGETVVVSGKGLTGGTAWKFGADTATCTPVTGATDTKVSCVVPTPTGGAGAVSVSFTPAASTPYGTTSKATYTYSDLG